MTGTVGSTLLLVALLGPGQPLAGREPDELMLQQLGIRSEPEFLLAFARQRASGVAAPNAVQAAIQTSHTGTPTERASAQLALLASGPAVLPHLRRAGRENDGPERDSLRSLTLALERDSSSYTAAIVRLLVKRSPPGAAGALLGLIAVAEDDMVLGEIRSGLGSLARRDAASASALRKALEDPLALRRALAIEAFARAMPTEAGTTFKTHLNDPVPVVRLRAALALAPTQEEGVARLIVLLSDLPIDLAQEAEEFLMGLAQEQAPRMLLSEKPMARAEIRDAWQKWWDASTGPAMLTELRNRTLLEEDRAKAARFISMLGNEDFDVREKATTDLKTMGPRIRSQLVQAAGSDDLEVAARVKRLLEGMAKENATPMPSCLPRVLALRRPAGAIETLLAYLPFSDEPALMEEVANTLEQIARVQPEARRTLVAALKDGAALRRQLAAEALGRLADLESVAPLRDRLDDPDVSVRLRVALALIRHREAGAVPVLIELLDKVSTAEDDRLLDDFLTRLSEGLTRPTLPEGTSETARKKRQIEWTTWWKANQAQAALPRYDEDGSREVLRNSGLTLVVLNGNNSVVAYDSEFRIRWTLAKLQTPFDAQVLPGDRVLVAEHDPRRVTERNLQGDILWEKTVPGNPLQVERLPSGNTVIVCRDRLLEVTRTGREVLTILRPVGDLYSARKLRDGSFACLSNQGRYFRLDAHGKELSSFRVTNGLAHLGNDLLPGGGALIPISWQNKITEYDREGKIVKEHTFGQPASVQRLPSGGMLVVNQQWPPRLIELDRAGQPVREASLPSNPIRAVRR